MKTLTLRLDAYEKTARDAIAAAQALADQRHHPEVEPLHLLYVLLEAEGNPRRAIARAGVDPDDVLVEAEALLRRLPSAEGVRSYLSRRLLDLLGRAEGEAARGGGVPVGVDALLLACGQEAEGAVRSVLRVTGLSAPVLRSTLAGEALGGGRASEARPASRAAAGASETGDPLELYGRDLTRMASQDLFDPTVGRDAELRRILQVLARRRENNPLLVGEPGIGKTAIVQALAKRIALGDVPTMLRGKRLVALEMGTLLAGAKLRGQLEERMRQVLDAVRDAGGAVVLFLSDLPAVVSSSGAGGLIASALARGELRVIATATPEQARKVADEDAALAGRFVAIPIEPPSDAEAVGVLRGVVDRFEIAHGVRISDPALVAAVSFARRYVQGGNLPKAAIDLIDEAAARVKVEMESVPTELDALERRLQSLEIEHRSLHDDHDPDSTATREKMGVELETLRPRVRALRERWQSELALSASVRSLKEELGAAQRELEQAHAGEDHGRAGELRFGSIPLLEGKLKEAEEALGAHGETLVHDTVLAEDVADVVATWTGVPVSKMLEEETAKLLRMEESLRERVVGQDPAVGAVSRAVRRARTGLRDPGRPIGSFLFLGPTGVGKTELAKALAEFLFDDEHSLTRLDMSEFMEKHMVARLLGSPPGYVDSDQGGFLTEAVRRRPYSVVLFDEMEKAHPDVFNILLQVLDDGRLTDSRGRPARFQDTVIIMTSNVGSSLILDHDGDNESLREKVEDELHRHFRPEFLNRIDDVVIFDPLDREALADVADIQLRRLGRLLVQRRIGLEITDAARERIVELGYDPAFGARPLKRVILKELQDPLAQALLEGGFRPGDQVQVDYRDGDFSFEKTK